MTVERSRTGRLLEAARGIFVWSGLAVLLAIALVAAFNLALVLAHAASNLGELWVVLALVGVLFGSLAAIGLLLAAWWFAGRSRFALRLTVGGGLAIVALGRLAIAVVHDSHMSGESRVFDATARGLLAGDWAFNGRAPGYPISLSGAYALFGSGPMAGELLNLGLALIGAATLYALLNARVGPRAGVIGLYLFAMWPAAALISNVRLAETMYIALILLAALAALASHSALSGGLTGVLLGLGQYVRPTTLALLPAYMLARWWPALRLRTAFLRTALPMVLFALLVMTPALAYNVQTYGEPSLSTTLFGGANLYVGTDEEGGGQWNEEVQAEIDALTPGGTKEDSEAAARAATDRIVHDPLLPFRLVPTKLETLWGTEDYGVQYAMSSRNLTNAVGTFPTLASNLFYTFVVFGTLVFAYLRRHDLDGLTVLCLGLVLSVSLIHFLYEVRDRYHAYVTPLFIAVTAVGVAQWLTSRRIGDEPAAATTATRLAAAS